MWARAEEICGNAYDTVLCRNVTAFNTDRSPFSGCSVVGSVVGIRLITQEKYLALTTSINLLCGSVHRN